MATAVHGNTIYPWRKWMDRRPHSATRGVHFQCSVASFRSVLYTAAAKAGMTVTTSREGDTISFQFEERK